MKKFLITCCAVALLSGCENKTQEGTTTEAGSTADMGSSNVTTTNSTASQPTTMSQQDLIERGKYLVAVGSCNDCHSPKQAGDGKSDPLPDPKRLFSGHPANEKLPPADKNAGRDGWVRFSMGSTAMIGPWGTSFSANLTPDATGIGNWTLDNFKTALREGKYKGMKNGRQLLPPMPWPNYRNMTDEDVEAIFTYLKSLPPIKNVVPAPLPPAAS